MSAKLPRTPFFARALFTGSAVVMACWFFVDAPVHPRLAVIEVLAAIIFGVVAMVGVESKPSGK